jgi:hypothetical protein
LLSCFVGEHLIPLIFCHLRMHSRPLSHLFPLSQR